MKNQIVQTLSEFGLSENEIKVYIEAIKHKEISPYKLSKLVKLPRTTVYDVMTNLALKKLITIKTSQGLEKQQTWIIAKNPSILRDILRAKYNDLTRLEVDIVDILPHLKSDYLTHQDNADFRFYPGIEGVKKVFEIINAASTQTQVCLWDHQMPMDTLGKEYINKDLQKGLNLRAKKYPIKTIIPLNEWTKHVLSYQYQRNHEYVKHHNFRYIEKTGFNLYQDIYLFLDRMAVTMAKDDEVWGLVIKSNLLVKSFMAIFDFMWQQATPVTQEFMESLGDNEFLKEERNKIKKR